MSLSLDKLSILIVEDTKPMQLLLASVIESLGFAKPFLAKDGVEGYDMFRRYNPDIVMTDWMMDPCDGLELTRKIRTHITSPNKMVPVILITGYSSMIRVGEARDAGVTEFLSKPFTANDVSKRISHIINNPRDFVSIHEKFFGPDRRRRKSDGYTGPVRRDSERKKRNDANTWTIDFEK